MSNRWVLTLAALLAALAVGLGAYSAHGLEGLLRRGGHEADLTQRLDWFATGVQYHMYHALALALVGLVAAERFSGAARLAAFGFLAGIVLFSGSLYVMTLAPAEWRKLGAIVPLGGASFIAGWIALAVAAWRR